MTSDGQVSGSVKRRGRSSELPGGTGLGSAGSSEQIDVE